MEPTQDFENIQVVKIKGSPKERGLSYGRQAEKRIRKSITFYKEIFDKHDIDMDAQGQKYAEIVKKYDKRYYETLRYVAKGANVPKNLVFAVNARTEIKSLETNECSAVFDKKKRVLAQTWDWGKEALDHVVVLLVNPDEGKSFVSMTEAGMLAKIGLNEEGVGVCLSALTIYEKLSGIPVHILLRRVLEHSGLDQIKEDICDTPTKTAGNILTAQKESMLNIEIAGSEKYISENTVNRYYAHTNHYLEKNITKKDMKRHESSFSRYDKILKHAAKGSDIEEILCDDQGNKPILRKGETSRNFGRYGTVLSVKMDLDKKRFYITDGYPGNYPFERVFSF